MGERADASYWERVARCVAAVEGDVEALGDLRNDAELNQLARTLRLQAALAVAADSFGVEWTEGWQAGLQASMASWLLVDQAVAAVGSTLGTAGHPWAPIKGYDVGTRFYRERESRETSDLDVLVGQERFDAVRQELETAGWTGLSAGPRAERYMHDEGYAWQAGRSSLELLEVHFRFWGVVPDGLEREVLSTAVPDPQCGTTACRPAAEHSYLIAAVHAWTQEVPRSLNDWRDMEQIARSTGDELARQVADCARRWELELPVALSAFVADRLWPSGVHETVLDGLQPHLKRRESEILSRLAGVGPDGVPWSRIALARLLSGRPSRAGWRSVWRRLWAHPGAVEKATPEEWSWPRRRLRHLRDTLIG